MSKLVTVMLAETFNQLDDESRQQLGKTIFVLPSTLLNETKQIPYEEYLSIQAERKAKMKHDREAWYIKSGIKRATNV